MKEINHSKVPETDNNKILQSQLNNNNNNNMTNEWIEWPIENRIRTTSAFRGSNTCSSTFLTQNNNNQHNYKFNANHTTSTTTTSGTTTNSTNSTTTTMGLKHHHHHLHHLHHHHARLQRPRGKFLLLRFFFHSHRGKSITTNLTPFSRF